MLTNKIHERRQKAKDKTAQWFSGVLSSAFSMKGIARTKKIYNDIFHKMLYNINIQKKSGESYGDKKKGIS